MFLLTHIFRSIFRNLPDRTEGKEWTKEEEICDKWHQFQMPGEVLSNYSCFLIQQQREWSVRLGVNCACEALKERKHKVVIKLKIRAMKALLLQKAKNLQTTEGLTESGESRWES